MRQRSVSTRGALLPSSLRTFQPHMMNQSILYTSCAMHIINTLPVWYAGLPLLLLAGCAASKLVYRGSTRRLHTLRLTRANHGVCWSTQLAASVMLQLPGSLLRLMVLMVVLLLFLYESAV